MGLRCVEEGSLEKVTAAGSTQRNVVIQYSQQDSRERAMRICMVCGTYPPAPCGIADGLRILAEGITARGAEVSVVTSSYLGVTPNCGNPTILPVVNNWGLSNAFRVVRSILATQPDVVHFQFPNNEYRRRILFNLLVPLVKMARPSTRVVVTFHEFLKPEEISWRKFLYIARIVVSVVCADAIIVVAPDYQQVLHRLWPPARRVPCKVVRNASNVPRSQLTVDELANLRVGLGIGQDALLLGYFGFIHPGKGFEDLLEILKILRSRGVSGKLLVLGELTASNEYHREILARISRDNLASRVILFGRVDAVTVANYLAACDAAIFPFTEGVHVKAGSILAATEQGVFTVTTSKARNGFIEPENVYYARPRDAQEMAEAVLQYAGRRVPPGSFPWRTSDQVADDNLEVYMDLLFGRPRPKRANLDARDSLI
jgi:glycosyltransferase involved in cell wall biosynthesis